MSCYALLGRMSKLFRTAVAAQVPHDMAVQVADVLPGTHERDVEARAAISKEDVGSVENVVPRQVNDLPDLNRNVRNGAGRHARRGVP